MITKNKIKRLSNRLRDPEWRRYGYLLLGGKALGIAILLTGIYYVSSLIGTHVTAADAPPPPVLKGNDIVNPINTVWVLVAAFLVFGMQVGFTMLGLALLVDATGQRNFVRPTLIATLIGVVCIAGFYFAQWLGMFRFLALIVARLANSPEWQSLVESGETLDRTVRTLYARRRAVMTCCIWTIISLVGGSGEIWIALHALDLHATLVNAVILQSTALTIRSAAFAVPGGLGVQEGGYLFVGNLLGIPGDAAFALSLIARVRELALGVPGVISWQLIEARRLWRARLAAMVR